MYIYYVTKQVSLLHYTVLHCITIHLIDYCLDRLVLFLVSLFHVFLKSCDVM